jgi:hypothetical protein
MAGYQLGSEPAREVGMAKSDKPTTNKSKPGISSPDKLLKTGKDSKIELTDDELSKVAGGKHVANIKYA